MLWLLQNFASSSEVLADRNDVPVGPQVAVIVLVLLLLLLARAGSHFQSVLKYFERFQY